MKIPLISPDSSISVGRIVRGSPHDWLPYLVWAFAAVMLVSVLLVAIIGIPLRYVELRRLAEVDTLASRLGLRGMGYVVYMLVLDVVFVGSWAGIAGFVVWRRRGSPLILFFAMTILSVAVTQAAFPGPLQHVMVNGHYPAPSAITVVAEALQAVSVGCTLAALHILPDGRVAAPWSRVVIAVWLALSLVWFLFPDAPFNQIYGDTWSKTPALSLLVIVAFIGAGVVAQIQRYRRATSSAEKQQIKWIVFGFVIAFVGGTPRHVWDINAPGGSLILTYTLIVVTAWPACLAVALLRYHLWDIDILINRTLVYGALTAVVVGVYTLIVTILGVIFQTGVLAGGNFLISLVASGVVAVLFHPLRGRLQRGVNRLMFGERDEPYRVMSRLGQHLQAAIAPDAALHSIVETVAQALKLPYAAITTDHELEGDTIARYGEPKGDLIPLPLVYEAKVIGQFVVAPRSPGEDFSPKDWQLLQDIAHQAGPAVHAARLTADLQRSRKRIVTAREEERRRLQRDLHDGLGPRLAGQALELEEALELVASDPVKAVTLLAELHTQTQTIVEEVRQLVYELRPVALNEVGLVQALRLQAARLSNRQTWITVEATPDDMPGLPAAVEVAVYRIVLEAVTNVLRHARARACTVRLALLSPASQPVLQVEVIDDGIGLPTQRRAGIGLQSMQERAEELGGSFQAEPLSAGGTRITIRISISNLELN